MLISVSFALAGPARADPPDPLRCKDILGTFSVAAMSVSSPTAASPRDVDALREELNLNRSRDSVQLMSEDMAKGLGFYDDRKWGNPSAAGTAVAKLFLDHDPRLKNTAPNST